MMKEMGSKKNLCMLFSFKSVIFSKRLITSDDYFVFEFAIKSLSFDLLRC